MVVAACVTVSLATQLCLVRVNREKGGVMVHCPAVVLSTRDETTKGLPDMPPTGGKDWLYPVRLITTSTDPTFEWEVCCPCVLPGGPDFVFTCAKPLTCTWHLADPAFSRPHPPPYPVPSFFATLPPPPRQAGR